MLGHQKTSEEALGTSESAAAAPAPTMAPGSPSREKNRIARVGRTSPHARENAPEGTHGEEPVHGKQQQQQQPPRSGDSFGKKQNVTVVPHPRRCHLMLNMSRTIRGAPERRRGVRGRVWLRGGERRGPGEVEEGPTCLDGGWSESYSRGPDLSQLVPGTK